MVKKLTQAVKETAQETRLWAYAAWTLPFAALALIVFEHYIGNSSWVHITMVAITTIFFSVSVFWWWWALNKVVHILAAMKDNEERFEEVIDHLKEAKSIIREYERNVGNRKWRKPLNN